MPKKTFDQVSEQDITHEMVNSHIIEELKAKEGVKIVAKPIDIFSIIPDVTQPRRAIPFSVRSTFKNQPDLIPVMLTQWKSRVEDFLCFQIDVADWIENGGEGSEIDPASLPSIVTDYLDLISLAASIHREGLTNAITVSDVGDLKRIETGERRYLAHHLLWQHVDDTKYAKIAAQTVTRDVWRQASENGARKPLNAIGLARQLALLIMDMYEGDRDVFFDKFEALILPGECDRKFYAQVANGNTYRIKRGMAQRILDVTGLKSKHQLYLYRNLLKLTDNNQINDILWTRADENNWTENALRDVSQIPINDIYSVITRENWSLDDLRVFLKTDDRSTAVDLSTQKAPTEAPTQSSVLPKRKEPSTTTHHWTTDPYQADPDPDLDEDVYTDDPEPPESEATSSKPVPPEPQHNSLSEALIYAQRQAIAPTVRLIISLANHLEGQTITTGNGDKIFKGKALVKMLQLYLDGSVDEITSIIDDFGDESVRDDISQGHTQILDIFDHLARETQSFMNEIINIALDYGN